AYDMSVRGGKVDWLKLGTDFLGVLPGLGAFKGFKAVGKLKGLAKLRAFGKLGTWGEASVRGIDGIGHNFLNGLSVTLTNKVLAGGLKLGQKLNVGGLPERFAPIGGKQITAIIKGNGLASALHRMFSGENGGTTGYQEPETVKPTPIPSPSPQ